MNVDGAGAAKRRRERRLRSWWRHERMSIACALAEALHHSSGAPKYDKRVVEDAKHGAVRGQTTATRVREATGMQYFSFDDEGKPVAGERFRPMVKDLRRIPVHVEEPSLDVPALQMVEQPVDVDSFFRISVPTVSEQVIEVPKLALPVRAVQRAALSEPQLVEQLVEVPTVLSYSLLQQRTAEQIIDIPVPGRARGGGRGGLHGLSQGQGSTAVFGTEYVDTPVPHGRGGLGGGGLHSLSQGQGSTAVFGAEHVDAPVPHGGDLHGLSQGQGSTALCGAVHVDIPVPHGRVGKGEVFKVFPEDRVPQRLPLSRPSLLIVFKVFPEDRVPPLVVEMPFLFRLVGDVWRIRMAVCTIGICTRARRSLRLQRRMTRMRMREDEEDEAEDEDLDELDDTQSRFPAGFLPMRMCRWFPSGNCRQGWGCMFAHSVSELHPLARGQRP